MNRDTRDTNTHPPAWNIPSPAGSSEDFEWVDVCSGDDGLAVSL